MVDSTVDLDRLSAFQYDLPAGLIAQRPLDDRPSSRLLVLPSAGTFVHTVFHDLVRHLREGDLLVRNVSRVIPARLKGTRPTGGRIEILLLSPAEGAGSIASASRWNCLLRPARKLPPGTQIEFSRELSAQIVERGSEGLGTVDLSWQGDLVEVLERVGTTPLPPYIHEVLPKEESHRYQTTYSRVPGSAAAPTAGFHFTPEFDARLASMGVGFAEVVLHVGLGTFRPVTSDDLDGHQMHREWYSLDEASASAIDSAHRIIAVGTTAVRVLETCAGGPGKVRPGSGWTDIFIRPPYKFRAVDGMITNFHLPGSTLLMLVCAMGGYDRVIKAYRDAVASNYRFFSFGDAMLVFPLPSGSSGREA